MNKKESISREKAEEKEGLDIVKNDVPENRMQNSQQIQNTDAALDVKPAEGSFNKKKVGAKGDTLKQQVISDAITGSTSSAGIGINAAGRAVSGTVGGILGASNSTPQAGKARSDSRTGKKLDRVATKLNYTPSEQIILAVDESKPLADSADCDQGYNGTYRNENARSQKILGAVPADLLYQRSVDFIFKDKLYFVEGQQVFQTGDSRTNYDPQETYDEELADYVPTVIHTGNYLHRNVYFGLDSNGQVEYVYFDVDDITPDAVSADDANCAAAHRLIKMNVAELDRMNMDAKAGDEKADIWTCLARAIKNPTEMSYLLSSIEADTGAYVYLAYSKASTNFSFQLNRAAKDGLDIVGPAIEECVGWRTKTDNSVDIKDEYGSSLHTTASGKTKIFNFAQYRQGDPAIMIDAYDSVNKYNNKADLLLQPRGWRMHLQTADNNINSLKMPKLFANVYAGTETYSTIDREYDPLLPICMTDKANLITTHNLNELSGFALNRGAMNFKFKVSSTNFETGYANTEKLILKQNSIKPFKGLGYGDHIYIYWKETGSSDGLVFDKTTGYITMDADSSDDDKTFEIVVTSKGTSEMTGYTRLAVDTNVYAFDTYAHDVILKVPTVQDDGTTVITEVDILEDSGRDWFYKDCKPIKYAYSDLRNNYVVNVKHPLVYGLIDWLNESIGGKILSLLNKDRGLVDATNEFKIPLIFSTQYMTLAQLAICAATPWIQRVRQNSMKDIIYYEDNVKEYPYSKLSSIKDVPFKNYVNFEFSDYDHPLVTKVMNPVQAINWSMPEFFWKLDDKKIVLPWYFNECDLVPSDGSVNDDANTMSMPSVRSGIRLGFLDDMYGMTEKDIRLSLDRMTKTFLRNSDIASKCAYKYGRTTDGQVVVTLTTNNHFTIGDFLKAPRELGLSMDAPLGLLTIDFDEASAKTKDLTDLITGPSYRIKAYVNPNTHKTIAILANQGVNIVRGSNYVQKWFEVQSGASTSGNTIAGLVFGMNDDDHEFEPFAALATGAYTDIDVEVVSYMRSINTRLQFLPFVISPFDAVKNANNNLVCDIYDFAYWFGLAGFRASDYRESVYNRSKEVVNQGFLFVDDPWILDSPIISGASKSTGVKESKGYTLK